MLASKYSVLLMFFAVAACGSGGGDTTQAPPEAQARIAGTIEVSFQTPTNTGQIDADLAPDGQVIRGKRITPENNGYAYALGTTTGGGFTAAAGIVPTTEFLTTPTAGSVDYTAQYLAVDYAGIREIDGQMAATGGSHGAQGDIILTATFDDGTLTGEAAMDTDAAFTVAGTMNGPDLSGTVTFRGVEGSLTGLIGSDNVVGAFIGASETDVYAGGFIGNAVAAAEDP